jgi:hypothetical protein
VQRAFVDRGNEARDHGVVDLIRFNPMCAGIAREARQAEMRALSQKLCHQIGPGGAKLGLD